MELLDLAGHMRDDGEGVCDEVGEVVTVTLKIRAVILSHLQGHRDAVDMTGFRGDTVDSAETMKRPGCQQEQGACQQDGNLWVIGRPVHWGGQCSFFLLHLQFVEICRAEIFFLDEANI